nr:putative membrane protein c6f6.13c [Quercus suber]
MASLFSQVKAGLSSSGNQSHQHDEQEESLTTILTTGEDRSALTILVADCTEVMRKFISDIFDANQTGTKADHITGQTGDQVLQESNVKDGAVGNADQEKMQKELAQREKELSGPKMQELKLAVLDYFDEWRNGVIQRIGEIVNAKEEPSPGKTSTKPKQESTPEDAAASMHHQGPPEFDQAVDETMRKLYSPVETTLSRFEQDKKALILHSLLLILLSLENYQSYSRTLLLYLTTSLGLPVSLLSHDESKVARGLLVAAENMKAEDETKKKAEENQGSRKWKVGLATVAGAALIGVTGGLAAPLLAAGIGTTMGALGLGATAAAGYLGTLAGSAVLVGGLFGAYGGRMTGKMMDQYAREVEDFGFVPIHQSHKTRKAEYEYRRLRVAIGISGWLTTKDEVVEPWKVIGMGLESFALRFELEALMNLGNSMLTMVKSAAWGYAKVEIIKRTVFASLYAGLWPLALLKVGKIIDNPFSVASWRAVKAGEVLADAIINKAQGERPVTLVGYSLGAKVIFTCLQRLAERKAFGLVETAVLIGAPAPSTAADWRMIRAVVSGRVVNVYSTNDYILAFLYRSSSIQYGVAGLQAVEGVNGIENVDVSDLVTGHTAYRLLTGPILNKIGFEDVDNVELAKEAREFEKEEQEEARQRAESIQQEGQLSNTEVSDEHIQDLEKEIQEKNKRSYLGWAQEKMVGAGSSAAGAYEKAKQQWNSPGAEGGSSTKPVNDADDLAKTADMDVPTTAGDGIVRGDTATKSLI